MLRVLLQLALALPVPLRRVPLPPAPLQRVPLRPQPALAQKQELQVQVQGLMEWILMATSGRAMQQSVVQQLALLHFQAVLILVCFHSFVVVWLA